MSDILYKSKDFAESVARSFRCSGVKSVCIKEIVAYEVITDPATFQDHYELWLIENNKTKEEWSYEKCINEHCFKDLRGKNDK